MGCGRALCCSWSRSAQEHRRDRAHILVAEQVRKQLVCALLGVVVDVLNAVLARAVAGDNQRVVQCKRGLEDDGSSRQSEEYGGAARETGLFPPQTALVMPSRFHILHQPARDPVLHTAPK